jgi:hypothetical protein
MGRLRLQENDEAVNIQTNEIRYGLPRSFSGMISHGLRSRGSGRSKFYRQRLSILMILIGRAATAFACSR